jgi:D-alanyl-lipoteichoic acid acyltransferase DltB (MBOAT superfamily)
MLFNSLAFAVFLPIVFILYWVMPHKFRWILLLVASYYFYMSWNAKYVFLILFTTVISYNSAIFLEKQENKKMKKLILTGTAILCLGVLFVFKYFNFVSESITKIIGMFSINLNPITLNLLLPVGISFYTFQTLSYVVDVYRGDVKAERHFGYYAVFISFFPQLVAGPIERTRNLLPQIKKEHKFDYGQATYGLKLMAWGYLKKLAIADVLSQYVDKAYSSLNTCTGFDLLVAVFFFTIQIYCDFSGYSDIAIGTAKLLGINLMKNFNSPYFSTSIKEFWNRWHISLSTWFKDYVYIPLGGNRCSKAKRDRNLLITFLTSGLWHGASWTYVIWGAVHGLAQLIENHLNIKMKSKVQKIISWVVVFVFCNIAWVFFRAESFSAALTVLYRIIIAFTDISLLTNTTLGLSKKRFVVILLLIGVLAIYDFMSLKYDVIEKISEKKIVLRWIVYLMLVVGTFFVYVTMGVSNASFVYFQF